MSTSPTPTPATAPQRLPGRGLTLLALGLAGLGIILYIVQLRFGRLMTPWYMPCLATLGLVFVVVALRRARTAWRWLTLVLVLLLAGAQWTFVLATRLPGYSGPVTVGKPLPEFETTRADGSAWTQRNLEGDQNHVLVFFRGRW